MIMQPDLPIQTQEEEPTTMMIDQNLNGPQTPSMPENINPVQKKSFNFKILLAIVVLLVLSIIGFFLYKSYMIISGNASPTASATPQPTPSDPTANWVEHKFDELSLTFKAPSELKLDRDKTNPDQFVAYLQNDKLGDEFFQMYFVYQTTGNKVKRSDIETFKNDARLIIPGTQRDIEVGGYDGFFGQVNDKKKRFITALIKDDYWLLIYTAEPTQSNKELTDNILVTFEFSK